MYAQAHHAEHPLHLRVAPGASVCVQLTGGPASERLAAKGDSVAVAVTSSSSSRDDKATGVETATTSNGQRKYTLSCGADDFVDYTATFTSAVDGDGRPVRAEATDEADEVDVEAAAAEGAKATAAVRVTCAAPEAVVVDLLSDLQVGVEFRVALWNTPLAPEVRV